MAFRNKLTYAIASQMMPGQGSDIETVLGPDVEDVSAPGALSLDYETTRLSVDGTDAFTLAAPRYAGQIKRVVCIAAANSPLGTLTVSSPDDTSGFTCPATFLFTDKGQTLVFEGTPALKWRCIQKVRTGAKTVVVGTTELTGIADMQHLNLSIDGTKTSTGTKGIPVGAAPGEILVVGCSAAANTPHGDIYCTAVRNTAGTAGNTLDDFTAVTDHVVMMWTGAEWQILNNHTSAVTVTTV